ncbi:MAG: UpxY family transcription antiterminator [Candidatus Eremiobacteraeota bacterium]|nr:UpxY family transcription antiterminator [Candidatus Eremiobacteraeota bacterium]
MKLKLQNKAPHATAHVTERRVAHPPQEPTGASWFVLRLRSRFDFAVRDQLRADSIEEFLPTREETTRWTDRMNVTTRPLFSGYIFARFDPREASRVRQTRGVVQILSIAQEPVPVPDEVIANLQRIAANPALVECCPYVAGSTVRVERGPFAGVSGIITRVKGGAVLSIPVEILGRSVSVEIDAADVATAD